MSKSATFTAIFQGGSLTPTTPISLPEGTEVSVTMQVPEAIEEDEDSRKIDRETDYFAAHQSELQKQYPHQYVAIDNGQVIDFDDDEITLILRVGKQLPDVVVFIKHVDEVPIPEYFVPSIRLEREV